METWRFIKDFPKYEISNLGRIRSYIIPWKDPRILAGILTFAGYRSIKLCEQERRSVFYIHRLVLEAFIGPCPSNCETNHKNGIKTDNRVENLEWITRSENTKHAFRIDLKTNKGIMGSKAKLRDEDVLEIRRLARHGARGVTIARMYKVTSATVYDIVKYKSWNHI